MQQEDANDRCEEKMVCIQATEPDSSGQEFEDSHSESGSGSYDYHVHDEHYDSTHSEPEHPTLTDTQELDEEDDRESTDSQMTPVIGSPTCDSDRQFLLGFNYAWIPHCDCQGYYEPVQCWMKGGQLECWCSSRSGFLIGNTRTVFSCTDSQQL